MKDSYPYIIAGSCAGIVTGILGTGGGLILVPLLSILCRLPDSVLFPCSLAIMFPICITTLIAAKAVVTPDVFLPYLLGGVAGGFLAAALRNRIPTLWLHRVFGIFILWGGIRFLCS